jgi:hypothetical protein
MSQRHSLLTPFLDNAHCVAAIDALHALYRKEHKRSASVELFCSSFRDTHTITLYAEPGDEAQVEWFKAKLATLYPSN